MMLNKRHLKSRKGTQKARERGAKEKSYATKRFSDTRTCKYPCMFMYNQNVMNYLVQRVSFKDHGKTSERSELLL